MTNEGYNGKLFTTEMKTAIHEAGHFVMMLLLTKHAPFYVHVSKKYVRGVTIQTLTPKKFEERALVLFAGYAAEKVFDGGAVCDDISTYMHHDDSDFQMYLDDCREQSGKETISGDSYVLALELFKKAQQILLSSKALLFHLASELMDRHELSYEEIKDYCHDNAEAFPILKSALFDKFSSIERLLFENDVLMYRAEGTLIELDDIIEVIKSNANV